jgi:hypothetical protein
MTELFTNLSTIMEENSSNAEEDINECEKLKSELDATAESN